MIEFEVNLSVCRVNDAANLASPAGAAHETNGLLSSQRRALPKSFRMGHLALKRDAISPAVGNSFTFESCQDGRPSARGRGRSWSIALEMCASDEAWPWAELERKVAAPPRRRIG